jgi:hypothetical protein
MHKDPDRNHSLSDYRKIAIKVSIAIIIILIVDTLITRQILPYNNTTGSVLFLLNIVVAYGLGSWVLFKYVRKISEEIIGSKSFIDHLIKFAMITQYSLLILFSLIFVDFYLLDNSTPVLSSLAFAISTISASIIMSFTAYKFFLWFRASNRNKIILVYGLAATSLAVAMIFDGGAKLLMVKVMEEPSLTAVLLTGNSSDAFVYKESDKYNGDIQYEVIKPDTKTEYIVPAESKMLYQYLNGWIPITISFIFTWAITLIVLRKYYQRQGKLPRWINLLMILPLVLYFIGRSVEFYTLFTGNVIRFDDLPNPYLFRILFRIGVIGGSLLFGVAFFIVAKMTTSGKVKDCLTVAAIGAAMIGISLSPSALQQTYGVAGRSLELLASLLFSLGFYLSAVYIANDTSIRKSIGSIDKLEFLHLLGHAQMEIEIENKVEEVVRRQQQALKESRVIPPLEVDDYDVKLYVEEVLNEVKRKKSEIS